MPVARSSSCDVLTGPVQDGLDLNDGIMHGSRDAAAVEQRLLIGVEVHVKRLLRLDAGGRELRAPLRGTRDPQLGGRDRKPARTHTLNSPVDSSKALPRRFSIRSAFSCAAHRLGASRTARCRVYSGIPAVPYAQLGVASLAAVETT